LKQYKAEPRLTVDNMQGFVCVPTEASLVSGSELSVAVMQGPRSQFRFVPTQFDHCIS